MSTESGEFLAMVSKDNAPLANEILSILIEKRDAEVKGAVQCALNSDYAGAISRLGAADKLAAVAESLLPTIRNTGVVPGGLLRKYDSYLPAARAWAEKLKAADKKAPEVKK